MKKWMLLLVLFLFVPLSACGGGEDDLHFRGRVAQTQWGEDGSLSALVLDMGDGRQRGVFVDRETDVSSVVEDVLTGEKFLAKAPLGTEVSVYLRPDTQPRTLTAQDGTEYPSAGLADFVIVETARSLQDLVLSDGTAVEMWQDSFRRSYRLSDGTELLWESPQQVSLQGLSVGDMFMDQLPSAFQDGLERYYQERGALYDLMEELERAHASYTQNPEEFQSFLVEQQVSWCVSSPQVEYFLTILTLPVAPGIITEQQFTDAFDRESGEHILNEDLFTVGKEEALDVLLSQMDITPTQEREIRAAFDWSQLSFQEDQLLLFFPASSLPSQEYSWSWGVDYSSLSQVLQPWAMP